MARNGAGGRREVEELILVVRWHFRRRSHTCPGPRNTRIRKIRARSQPRPIRQQNVPEMTAWRILFYSVAGSRPGISGVRVRVQDSICKRILQDLQKL